MKLSTSLRTLAASALLVGISGVSLAGAATTPPVAPTHALFVETDATAGNQILSYVRATDGTVSLAGTYKTGGKGAVAASAVADPLASQGGLLLARAGTRLVAVNAGSNTLSVFNVSGTSLQLLQQISSGGAFPNSLAASGSNVAVLNAGGQGTVVEYHWVNGLLAPIAGQSRTLTLGNTTPPNFVAGPGQVGYSPNGQFLVVADKKSTNNFTVFTVSATGVLGAGVTTAAQNAVPFAFNFASNGDLVAAEASNSSVSTYTIGATGALTPVGTVTDGAKALCWITEARGYYFGSNAGSGTLSSFSVAADGTPTLVSATAATTHAGTTDDVTSPDGDFIYVESGGAGALDVFAVSSQGALTPVETLWNIPVASEGLAIS